MNPKLKNLNDDYQAASEEYQDTQKEIVTGVVDVACTKQQNYINFTLLWSRGINPHFS